MFGVRKIKKIEENIEVYVALLNEKIQIQDRQKYTVMMEMVYNGFFGKGRNVTHRSLKDVGMFNSHPYNLEYTKLQFSKLLEMGGVDVQNVIID